MPVPEVFKEFHKKAVAISEAEKNVLAAVLDYQNDPLKAMLMQNLQKDLSGQAAEMTTEEISLMNKYGLR